MTAAPIAPRLASVPADSIIVRDRLRKLLPDRVSAMQYSIGESGQLEPVDLVETGEGLRLIHGAVRVAACLADDRAVDAIIHPAGAFGTEADIRIREISHQLVHFDLTALERAVYIAEWRTAHQAKYPPAKPGRKKVVPVDDAAMLELSANFALNFPDVVQEVLGLSRRAVFLALKVASIDAEARGHLAPLKVATNQSELLAIAGEPPARQVQIALRLVNGADSVADAIADIDQTPAPQVAAVWERFSEKFSRLKPAEQDLFFALHEEAVLRWIAGRKH